MRLYLILAITAAVAQFAFSASAPASEVFKSRAAAIEAATR